VRIKQLPKGKRARRLKKKGSELQNPQTHKKVQEIANQAKPDPISAPDALQLEAEFAKTRRN